MPKGYQIVELEALDNLANSRCKHELLKQVLRWIITCLFREFPSLSTQIEIDVITVKYLGEYPALGLHYFTPTEKEDLAPMLESAAIRILNSASVSEFIQYSATDSTAEQNGPTPQE